jgi:hypothetical protein
MRGSTRFYFGLICFLMENTTSFSTGRVGSTVNVQVMRGSPCRQVGICCDAGLEPEPQRLADCWEEAFQALRKAAEIAVPEVTEVTKTVVAQAV